MNLGERLKISRIEKNISIRKLAENIGLSPSFISQIEQGKTSPSIENIKKIAHFLDISVNFLIDDRKSAVSFVKNTEQMIADSLSPQIKISMLSDLHTKKDMEPLIYEVNPGTDFHKDFTCMSTDNFIYMLDGELEFELNNNNYHLEKADSIYFRSNHKYGIKNLGNKDAKFLWVKK